MWRSWNRPASGSGRHRSGVGGRTGPTPDNGTLTTEDDYRQHERRLLMTARIEIDPNLVERRVMELAAIGACAETGVCRTVYSPEWVAAQDVVARWCRESGLTSWRDAVGSVWGRLEGREGGP